MLERLSEYPSLGKQTGMPPTRHLLCFLRSSQQAGTVLVLRKGDGYPAIETYLASRKFDLDSRRTGDVRIINKTENSKGGETYDHPRYQLERDRSFEPDFTYKKHACYPTVLCRIFPPRPHHNSARSRRAQCAGPVRGTDHPSPGHSVEW